MTGGRFRMAGTGTKPDITGTYNITGGVVEFYGGTAATSQTIRGGTGILYQNIEVNSPFVANSNSNINLRANGSFTILNGAIFTINDEGIVGDGSGTQSVTVQTGGTFRCGDTHGFSGGTGANATSVNGNITNIILQAGSTVEYSRATTTQVFSSRSDYQNVTISGGAPKTLNGPATMAGVLTLSNGLVNTDNTNILALSSTATCPAGGNDNSFVNGPMRKTGSADFIFPVGTNAPGVNHYRTIGVSNILPSSETFTARFIVASASALGVVVAPLQRVSRCEYWTLDRAGSNTANVTLSWTPQSKCNGPYVTDFTSVVVAHFNGTQWVLHGRNSGTGDETAGTVTWNNVSTFSPFAIGTTSVLQNPLPFDLTSFRATARNQAVQLDWSVNNNDQLQAYTVERSADGVRFEPVVSLQARGFVQQAAYRETDNRPLSGWNFYRIKATDLQQQVHYSHIEKVRMGNGFAVQVSPVPAKDRLQVSVDPAAGFRQVQLTNSLGQVLLQQPITHRITSLDLSHFNAGMYFLRLVGNQETRVQQVVKE